MRHAPLLLVLLLPGCARVEPAAEGGGAALMRNLLRARAVEIVVAPGPAEVACWEAAERIAADRRVECRVVAPSQRGDPRAARIVVGGPGSPPARSLVARLGIEVGETEGTAWFSWRNIRLAAPSDAIVAVLEDPERLGLPVTLLYGNDEAELSRYAACIEPGWKPWIRVHRTFEVQFEAPLAPGGGILEPWLVDVAAARERALSGYFSSRPRQNELLVKYSLEIEQDARRHYLDAVLRARQATERWTGASGGGESITLVLHARPERLAACAGGAGLSAWKPLSREVHALLARGIPNDSGVSMARARAEEILGSPAAAWVGDGAAVHAAGRWWGRDLEAWIAWLCTGDLAPSAAALADPKAALANSPHRILPMRAALFRFLLETRGETFLRALWAGSTTLALDPELERGFAAWLDDLATPHRAEIEARHAQRRSALLSGGFLAGVGIEEPGRSPERGFGSAAYEESLEEARATGARAAALTCWLAMEPDPPAVPDPVRAPPTSRVLAPFEGDLRVFCGLRQAVASGMRALLQPRVLTAPGGGLAGTGPLAGEAGWMRFFDGYARVLLHCALLCELAEADGLVLGGSMTGAVRRTTDDPRAPAGEDGWRRAGWSSVVRAARAAFSGTLTWAADSRVEADEMSFWSELDTVACELDLELDDSSIAWFAPPRNQLEVMIRQHLAVLAGIAREHGKPLILTQAGFRSGAPPPGAPRDATRLDDPGLQAEQLDALALAVAAAREAGALQGVILWRWSSDPDDDGVNGRDMVLRPGPARAAAARVLR